MIRILAAFCLFVQVFAQHRPGCKIDATKLRDPQPLVLDPHTYEYIYPPTDNIPGDQNLLIKHGETFIVACPGGILSEFPYSTIFVTCNDDDQLVVDDNPFYFYNLHCSQTIVTIRNTTQSCDGDTVNSRIIQIGYEVGVGLKWIPLLDVCFNYKTRMTFYTKFHLTKSIRYREYGTHDILDQPELYNLPYSVGGIYRMSKDTINKQVGLDMFSNKYLNLQFYRTRLTSQTEVFYSFQNEAVSLSINAFPEWPKSCYNWRYVDTAVQHYAIRNEVDLEVYTGTHGTVTVQHEKTFENVTLHMYVDENLKAFPIPGLMWRLAYEPITQKAVVFLTVNVPFKTLYEEHVICNDISDRVAWQPWMENTIHDYTCGYSYVCTYNDVKAAIPLLPNLKVSGILV